MRRAPTQPPRPLDRLVGRDTDLAALEAELARSQLVSVQGPPGVGKTRLAAELAVRSVLRGQKVAHCDVTECATAHDVTVRVATALGVATTEVAEQLAARPLLLVLDNAEHVASELAQCLEPWLLAAPELRVLATTRIRLRVVGEVVFDLAPLDDNAGAELFVERARAVRRDVGGDDRATILEVVRKLEGMPLAIELAAARSRLYEPAQLLAKLGRSAELLGGGPSRQRSLAAALELSFNLLGPLEMRALMQASVFRGGFTVEAAEAVIDLGGALVVEALEALVDHSLLWTRRVGTRRRLGLYMVVREFAAARLSAAEREAAQARHAAYFLRAGADWLADIVGPNGPSAIATIAAEAENLLSVHRAALAEGRGSDALDAALVLDPLFVTRGPIDHGLEILDQGLAAAPADHPRRLHALEVRANAMRYMHLETARGAYEELEREARAQDAKRSLARAVAGKGIVKLLLKDQTGESDVTRALVMQREQGDKLGALIAHASLGHLELHRNDLAVAREHFSRALALAVELRDPRNEGLQKGNLGLVEQECGRLDVARGAFERSLEVFRSLGDRRSEAWTLANLARVVQEQEQLEEARMLYTEAQQRHEEVGNRRAVGVVSAHLAQIEQWEGQLERARELYQQALVALDISGSTAHHALVTGCIATVLADLGLTDAARHAFERAESAFGIALDETTLAALSVGRGHLDLALGNLDSARRRHAEASANIDRWTVRFARMGLERALARVGGVHVKPRAPDHALVIGNGGRWFRAPGGAKVDLSRRRQLRLILAALATERRERPGHALTVEALFQQGWPGEVALPEAGASRVYVAISTLRRMGLRDALHRVDVGYLIDPEASVHVEAGN